MSFRRSTLALAAAAALTVLTGCGDPAAEETSAPEDGGGFPVTVASAGGELVVESRPQRIVSLSPTATEVLFAVGAGEQVVAVDDQSDFPEQAPTTDLSGFTPNVEAVAGFRPDLVVVSDDLGGIVDALAQLDVPVLMQPAPASLDEAWEQLRELGRATGHAEGAEQLAGELEERVDAAVASVPEENRGLSVYHELDESLFSATSRTFVGSVLADLGLENVADAVDPGNDYPQLSAEYLVQTGPEVVVLADTTCCGQTAETFAARPGFGELPAVQAGRVVEVDDAVASRWGPRIVEFAEQVAAALGGGPGR